MTTPTADTDITLTTHPAAEPPGRPTGPRSLREAWLPLLALCLAFFVEMVDNTVLNVALPTIGRALDAGTADLQWVTGAYSLTFGALLLTAGSLADRFGRRRILLAGLAAFGILSALVLLVTTAGQLIALRAALGVAAAAMAPVTMSLVFRLFDDEALRMRAINVLVVVGMSGFALGPIAAGSALAALPWQTLLAVNVPIAIIAWLGVRFGIEADRPEDLHDAPMDLSAAALTMLAIGSGAYFLTSGVENGWTAPLTLGCAAVAILAAVGFVRRERTAPHPMLDLELLARPTIRGAALAQLGSSVAMIAAFFGLALHFQYALGWSPMKAGLANLPFIVTMLIATPLAEIGAKKFGHRVTVMGGSIILAVSLAGLAAAVAVNSPYVLIAIAMVGMTLGIRIIMTVCAVALVEAMPAERTSIGAALNDTAQEMGSSIGVAVFGSILAAVVGGALPADQWSAALMETFCHGEAIAYLVLAVFLGVVSTYGGSTLTNSRTAEEPH